MKADFFTYIITGEDGSITSSPCELYRSLSQAENAAFSEFDYGADSVVQYSIEKIDQSAGEIAYGVYYADMYNRRNKHIRYIIHILAMDVVD